MKNPNGHHWCPSMIIFYWTKIWIFRTLPYSSFLIRCPAHQITYWKIFFLHHFLFRIRPFCEKWIILIYNSSYENFLEAGNSQNPLCWIRTTSQVAVNKNCRNWYLASFGCRSLSLRRHFPPPSTEANVGSRRPRACYWAPGLGFLGRYAAT